MPLMMNSGKNIENKHPLMMKESQICVSNARTKPNPDKEMRINYETLQRFKLTYEIRPI